MSRIVRRVSLEDGIEAARTIFDSCFFDEVECADGIHCLSSYRYDIVEDATGQLSKLPVHDFSSHGADAFRYSAVSTKMPRIERLEKGVELNEKTKVARLRAFGASSTGWMR